MPLAKPLSPITAATIAAPSRPNLTGLGRVVRPGLLNHFRSGDAVCHPIGIRREREAVNGVPCRNVKKPEECGRSD